MSKFYGLALTGLFVAGFASSAWADDDFMYRVCDLMKGTAFEGGAISFGGGEGCVWQLSDETGATVQGEELKVQVTRHPDAEQLQSAKQMYSQMLKNAEEMGGHVEALRICESGEQLIRNDGVHPPSMLGYFVCQGSFIDVTVNGAKAMAEREGLMNRLVELDMK